jgi:hypothetical protein
MSDLPTTAYGVLRQFSTSKQGIEMFSNQLIRQVKDGHVNALELKAYLKTLELIVEKVNEATRSEQLEEADKYGEKKFDAFGFEIEKAELGTKYDYSSCGDTVYERREVDLKTSKRMLDERIAFLKSVKEPLTLVDELTGEVVTIRPPLKKSTTGLRLIAK